MLNKKRLKVLSASVFIGSLLANCQVNFTPEGSLEILQYNTVSNPNVRKFTVVESEYDGKKPAMIMYSSDNGKSYIWFTLRPMGILTSDERALEIANRLEKYRKEKMISFVWGHEGYEKVIKVRTQKQPNSPQLVVTIPNEYKDVEIKKILYLLNCKMNTPGTPDCDKTIKS